MRRNHQIMMKNGEYKESPTQYLSKIMHICVYINDNQHWFRYTEDLTKILLDGHNLDLHLKTFQVAQFHFLIKQKGGIHSILHCAETSHSSTSIFITNYHFAHLFHKLVQSFYTDLFHGAVKWHISNLSLCSLLIK